MIFDGIIETEQFDLRSETDPDQIYSIVLIKAKYEPKFYVCSDYDPTWMWKFWNMSTTDYERVKMCILDIASECDDFDSMLFTLNAIFVEYFDDMLVQEEEHECKCGSECGGTCCNNHLN